MNRLLPISFVYCSIIKHLSNDQILFLSHILAPYHVVYVPLQLQLTLQAWRGSCPKGRHLGELSNIMTHSSSGTFHSDTSQAGQPTFANQPWQTNLCHPTMAPTYANQPVPSNHGHPTYAKFVITNLAKFTKFSNCNEIFFHHTFKV